MRSVLAITRTALVLSAVLVGGCSGTSYAADPPKPAVDLPPAKPGETRTAVFAAGCFWCTEAVFEAIEGVTAVESGYAGGTPESATYDRVSAGSTDHAECVRVTYDTRVSYGQLLQVLFTTHDPTTKDRQGPDHGRQYRSAIFSASPEEKRIAEAYLQQLGAAKVFSAPIVTTLEPLTAFHAAEPYHQDFVARHPDHPYVRAWARPKLEKLVAKLPGLLEKP